jgi:hypothetical protein
MNTLSFVVTKLIQSNLTYALSDYNQQEVERAKDMLNSHYKELINDLYDGGGIVYIQMSDDGNKWVGHYLFLTRPNKELSDRFEARRKEWVNAV